MTQGFKSLAMAAALLLAPAVPIAAAPSPADQAPASTQGQTVVVPFDPPLDRPLRYRRSKEVDKAGRTQSVWTVDEYIFSPTDDGFRLRVRTLDTGIEGADPATREAFRRTVLRFNRPFVLLLDERGAIVGMEDEEAYWSEMLRATEQMIREARVPTTPAEQAAVQHMVGLFRDTPPEARLAVIAEAAAPILEFGAVELTLGEEITNELETTGLFGATARHLIRVRPERLEGGRLFVTMFSSVPREDLIRNTEQFLARIPVTGEGSNTEAERARGLAELRSGAMSRETEAHYEIALDSGLTRRHRSVERIDVAIGGNRNQQTTTIVLEQLD